MPSQQGTARLVVRLSTGGMSNEKSLTTVRTCVESHDVLYPWPPRSSTHGLHLACVSLYMLNVSTFFRTKSLPLTHQEVTNTAMHRVPLLAEGL